MGCSPAARELRVAHEQIRVAHEQMLSISTSLVQPARGKGVQTFVFGGPIRSIVECREGSVTANGAVVARPARANDDLPARLPAVDPGNRPRPLNAGGAARTIRRPSC
jgi:hypothetical protein